MPFDARIELGPLCVSQGCRVRFEAFPNGIQQIRLLGRREVFNLISKSALTYNRSAVFGVWQAEARAVTSSEWIL